MRRVGLVISLVISVAASIFLWNLLGETTISGGRIEPIDYLQWFLVSFLPTWIWLLVAGIVRLGKSMKARKLDHETEGRPNETVLDLPSPNDTLFKSPEGNHQVRLVYEGEIRFGPAYFTAQIDSFELSNRHFGSLCCWLSNNLVVLEEWLTTKESEGPVTRLFLFDASEAKFSTFQIIEGGFIAEPKLLDRKLVYRKEYSGLGNIVESEVDLESIRNWKAI